MAYHLLLVEILLVINQQDTPYLLFCPYTRNDYNSKTYAVRRNYPITGNIRYLLKHFRPEIRQYFIEADNEAVPFTHTQRSLVYARSRNKNANKAFGTIDDVYKTGFEFISHSIAPKPMADCHSFRIMIGGDDCTQPYSSSVFNISAMSFGALSGNAILALNGGAKRGNFAHDTGEGSISPYHLQEGGDLIWELGSGYFGCRTPEGKFNAALQQIHAQNNFQLYGRSPALTARVIKGRDEIQPLLPRDNVIHDLKEFFTSSDAFTIKIFTVGKSKIVHGKSAFKLSRAIIHYFRKLINQ